MRNCSEEQRKVKSQISVPISLEYCHFGANVLIF